ncbi:MAG TPA: flagellar hook capping FlgD N-terminal domain-containing protein [Planctomycetota bacterium]|nr:flagellar hook capping FlgD N-terminal domain-containing protein [Planctomycetota bacterium]
MDLQSLQALTSGASAATAAPKELDKNAFMTLLVSQLKNQDPLEPVQNEDFVAQLATFSNLEQAEATAAGVAQLVALQAGDGWAAQISQSSALIGKQVEWLDPTVGGEAGGVVDSVQIEGGIVMLSIGGKLVPLGDVTSVSQPDAGDAGFDDEDAAADDVEGAA